MEMEPLYSRIQQTALRGFGRINRSDEVLHRRWEVEAGTWDVRVVRGDVLEKATTTRIRIAARHPVTGVHTRFDVCQVKAYPRNPGVPVLLVNVENRTAGDDVFAGFLDVAPVAASGDDLDRLRTVMRAVCEQHGQDYGLLSSRIADIYRLDNRDKALNAGLGIRLEFPAERVDLVREASLQWIEAYCSLVEKIKSEPADEMQQEVLNRCRAGICAFYMLRDVSFKSALAMGVPLEALTLGNFPPAVTF